jgi:hypothetical protein
LLNSGGFVRPKCPKVDNLTTEGLIQLLVAMDDVEMTWVIAE